MHFRLQTRILKQFVRHNSISSDSKDLLLLRLNSRSLIRISGNSVAEYVQGLITNDINHLLDGSSCMFAMFLNSRGRVLYDTLIYKQPLKDSFLIECDSLILEDLRKHLNLFKVRRKITVDVEDQYVWNATTCNWFNKVIADTGTNEECARAAKSVIEKFVDVQNICCSVDPRTPALGVRVVAPSNLDLNFLTVKENPADYYTTLRHKLGIGEGVKDHPKDSCFPLEANCDYLHGVSFHKGCYIGQELTARTHHTGVVRKRLMPMIFNEDASDLKADAPVSSNLIEKPAGKLRSVIGSIGLGLLRVDEVLKSERLTVGGKEFKTSRPFWWPNQAPRDRVKS